MNKEDQILNQLATNLGIKVGQLEGEKAVLQVGLHEANQKNDMLQAELDKLKEEKECE